MGGSSETLRAAERRLAADPSEPETLASLEHLLETPERLDAARLLASAHERAGNDPALIRALEVVGAAAGDAAEKVTSLKRIARIQRLKLRQPDLALATLMKAVDLRPEDAELHRFAREAAVEADAVEVLEELLDDLLDRVEGPGRDVVLEAIRRLNQPDEPRGATPNDLLSALQAFVTPGADRVKALPGLRQLAQQVDALGSLAEVVESESEKIEEPAELAALLRFVALLREDLKQSRQAAVVWNDLLAVQPDDLEALEHLRTLLAAAGDSKGAAEVLLRRARLPGADRLALLLEAADLFIAAQSPADALGALDEALVAGPDPRIRLRQGKLLEHERPEQAVEAYVQALAAHDLQADAAGGLERLLGVPATRAAAGTALEPYLRQIGDPRRLVEALEAQTGTADLPARRMRFVEIARLWEQVKEPRAALGAQLRAFHVAPNHERTRVDLELLAKALDAKDELLAAYEEALDRDPDVGSAALWSRVAELRQELGERDRALEAWARAAEAAPREEALLATYAAACRAQGDRPRLARVLRSLVDALPASPARTELLYELADLCDDALGDPAGAVRAYQELRSQAPGDRAVLKSLQRLHEKTGDAAGLEEALARDLELARQAGSEEVGALALRLGLLRLGRPGQEAGGLQLLGEVLHLEPGNAEALAAVGKLASAPGPLREQAAQLVTPALDKLEDPQVGARILEAQLATQANPAERAATLRRLADLHEGQLDDPDLAFLAITRALREQPQDEGLLRRCVALAEVTGAQEELEALLEELARAQPPGAAKAELWRALARSLQERSQAEEAIRAWTEVRAQSPADPEATERLGAHLEKGGRLEELADLIQHQADAAAPAQRPPALARLAAARERAGQMDEAVAVLHGLYALAQGQDALRSLERLLGKLGRHQERAEVLKRLATATGGEAERTDLLLQQAKAQLQAGEPARAADALAELLARVPDEPRAIAELVALANDPNARATALGLLESAFKDPKQGFQRVSVLELLVEARTPEEGRALRAELAALHETLGDARQAFAWRLRLLAENPADPWARAQAERLAGVARMEEELAGAYEDLLERQPPVDLRLGATDREQPILEDVLERTGRFEPLGELLSGRIRAAHEAGDEALELDLTVRLARLKHRALKDGAAALSLLTSVLQRREGHPGAAEALQEVTRPGEADSPALADAQGAYDALRPLLQLRPDDPGALAQMDRVCQQLQKWPELADVLERRIRLEAAGRIELQLRLAQLRRERLGDLAGAVSLLAEVLQAQPNHAGALAEVGRAIQGAASLDADPAWIEALCRQVLSAAPLQVEASDLLAALLEKAGRYQELEQLLQARLSVTLAPQAVIELEYRLAEVEYRRLQRPQPASARYRLVLERIHDHEGALAALAEIYESSSSWRDLSRVLGDLALARKDPIRRRIDHLRHAEALVRLGAGPPALAAARQAVELAPDNEAELRRLRDLFQVQGALPEVEKVLGLTAALHLGAGRTDGAVAALFELADLEEKRGDATALETILGHQPSNRRAYDRARALHERAGSWSALAALTARFLRNLEGDERLAALDALADLHESKLEDPNDAFNWARQAVLLDPGSAPRRERLERLGRSLHRAEELAETYRQLLAGPGQKASGAVAMALAAVEDADLDQVERAEKTLRDLLARDPGNAAVSAQLVQMFSRRELAQKSAEALELQLASTADAAARVPLLLQLSELHRLQRQWPESLSALRQVADLVTAPQDKAQALLDMARVQAQDLADPESAVATLLEALKHDPAAPEPFHALEQLYRQLERPAELLRAYEARLARAGADEQVELLFMSAELWDQRGDLAQADRCLEAVLERRPGEVRAMEELARLRRTNARWQPLVEILTRHAGVAEQPEVRAALCTELGEISLLHLQDPRGAEKWWRKALEQLPTHRPALRALGELDQREERWAHAAEMLDREAKLEQDAAARADLFHRAGVLREERLRDLVNARKSYDLALRSDELHWPSIRRQRALAAQAKAWPEYEEKLALEAGRGPSAAERGAAAVELAGHFAQRMQDDARAIEWYRHALEQQPGSVEAALPLADLLVIVGQWPRAVEVLEAAIPNLERDEERVRRLCQLSLAQQQLQRTAAALDNYGRALAIAPDDATALRGQFQLLDAGGHRAEAADALQRLLAAHGTSLPEADQVALGARLGELYRSLGRPAEAQAAAERALALGPGHPEALHTLVAVCDQLSAFDKSIRYRRQLAAVVGPDERYQLLVELAAIAHQKLADPRGAIDGYLQALQVRPGSLEVLQRLPAAYRDAGQERKAVETLQALLAHPDLPRTEWRRETLSLADLLGRQPSGLDGAVDVLEKAFDRDPAFRDAIQALETLLGRARQWKRLDTSYERAARSLSKAQDTAPAQAAIWLAAGGLRLKELKDRPAALAAFAARARLLPEDAEALEAFGDLGMEFPAHRQDALAAYVRALPATSHPEKLCAAAAQVAERSGDADTAYLASRAAQLLAAPTAAQEALLAKLAPLVQSPPELRAPVSDESWRRHLLHPALRGPLGELLALLFQWGGAEYGADLDDFKLHPKKHAVDLGTATHPALRHLVAVAGALGHPAPKLFSPFLAPQPSGRRTPHPDDAAGLRAVPTVPVSLVAGEKLISADPATQAAWIGHAVAHLRPEVAMPLVLGPERLAVVLEAAVSLVHEGFVSRADPKVLKGERKRLEKAMSSAPRDALPNALRAAREEDLTRYLEGARLTPLRVALLAAGDFAPVRTLFSPGDAALRDLVGFALGGDLNALRQQTQSRLIARR
ncbi:MAG TPA: tetratricopeptide repeat protein [Myxococcaceae bacterium]|nr:tetratricopeptide repeat protein [Myxococcaceae bacterium]